MRGWASRIDIELFKRDIRSSTILYILYLHGLLAQRSVGHEQGWATLRAHCAAAASGNNAAAG